MAELIFRHIDDFEPDEARAQLHGDRRAAAKVRRLERGPGRTVLYTEYDPGLTLEEHGHRSDHVIFVIDGFLHVGETPCPPGTMVLLEHGATFGPLVAGPDGTTLLEFYAGNPNPVPADPEGYQVLLADRGITVVPTRRVAAGARPEKVAPAVVRTRTNLEVRDVAESAAFYATALGFEMHATTDDPAAFALLVSGAGSLGLVRTSQPAVGTSVACVVEVTDFDVALESCTRAGARITAPATEQSWGTREFVFRDPDGHLVAVGEQLV
jgi:predicted enzyme related to lactoylglutathione lyase